MFTFWSTFGEYRRPAFAKATAVKEGQRTEGLKPACAGRDLKPKPQVLTCEHRRRVVAKPGVVEPVVAPAPRTTAPAQAPDAEVAIGVAVDRSPEEDVASVATCVFLPGLGDELQVLVEVIKDVGVEDGLVGELLAELVAFDDLVPLLLVRQEELDLLAVDEEVVSVAGDLHVALLLVLFDVPSVGQEGVGVAIHDVVNDTDLSTAKKDVAHLAKVVAFTE